VGKEGIRNEGEGGRRKYSEKGGGTECGLVGTEVAGFLRWRKTNLQEN